MILLLGATGYVGGAFAAELRRRGLDHVALSRRDADYARFPVLLEWLRTRRPSFVIHAAGFTGKPNVDACEAAWADTLAGNTLLPQTVGHACEAAGIPWGHVSSGCIYTGAKVETGGVLTVEPDLTVPSLRALVDERSPRIRGFREEDEPNFTFRRGPCSFYSGTKALGEEAMAGLGRTYVWRLRIPFDEVDGRRNYLSKLQRYSRVYDNVNSISHLGDYVRACLDLWARRAPFGTYNVTNPGYVTSRDVVGAIRRVLKPARAFEFWSGDAEFYAAAAKTPRSNCVLDVGKLLSTGVAMRPVEDAVEAALREWVPER